MDRTGEGESMVLSKWSLIPEKVADHQLCSPESPDVQSVVFFVW